MPMVVSVLAAALSAGAGIAPASVPGQQPSSAQGEVQLSTREVLLDLVVTDKKGHPITDLKPGEFEVYENGERQQVTSFGLVRVGPPPKGATRPRRPRRRRPPLSRTRRTAASTSS